ncbi:MAG: LruC domain-containing protein, partial [Bacteroidales bacterium]|nr:LruC domain-containing protein [Bacteroidales bacterium]
MKTKVNPFWSLMIMIFFGGLMIPQTGCRKSMDPDNPDNPKKFTDLKVDPAFTFESFVDLTATINVANSGSQNLFVIQLFQENPATGGKLIASGATDNNKQYKTILRVPTRLKELWVGKIAANGQTEYIAVPIAGKVLNYTFGSTKSTKEVTGNDCSTDCTVTKTQSGTYTSSNGTLCITGGSWGNRLQLNLTINAGAKVRICGYANVYALSGTGTLIISPSGNATIPLENIGTNIENYGIAQVAVCQSNKTINLAASTSLHNWGTFTISNSLNVKGILTNEGPFTAIQRVSTQDNGRIINKCSFYINDYSSNAFNIVTGNSSEPGLVNDANGYFHVSGDINISGQGYASFGLQSLIECHEFDIEGQVYGPATQGSQIHSSHKIKTGGGSSMTGYIDLWAQGGINPNNGTKGPNITYHNPGYTIPVPSCASPLPPTITSALTAAGMVGQAITPYVITATGAEPITYYANNLPAGLTYNSTTHTISGTPAAAGTFYIGLTADNFVGTDNETLVFTVTGGTPPAITSALTGSVTVNQPYTYTVEAVGTNPISYNATNLPAGLTFNPTTHQITGSPTSAGVYNIALTASNPSGADHKTLVLTVGEPPLINSPLTATGYTGQQFTTYTITASGTETITYHADNLPAGLIYDQVTHTINGTPTQAGATDVTLTANNSYGFDQKILKITIIAAPQPPVITSPLYASGTKGLPFSYQITADGDQPITFGATDLPDGLTFSGNTISGIPTATGSFFVTLTAVNSVGTDTEILNINIVSPSVIDSDGDGVPDDQDAYPYDPTRAFNSYYPNETDFGSYTFEDLWPSYGDYDCNDLVMNFNYKIVTSAQNKVVDLICKFKIKAAGASFNNGFGVSLSTAPENVESVTGCIKVGHAVTIDPKGYEAGHIDNTVIIPVDAVITVLGSGMVNTIHGGQTIQTDIQTVTVHLSNPQANIGTPPYNPFIFVNQDRAKEIHLKDHPPTILANPVYFGSNNDGSDPAKGWYYRSTTGLPWAMEIPVDFDYPVEYADIIQTYLHFAEWAQSSGVLYPDWYMDKPGYRNASNIY